MQCRMIGWPLTRLICRRIREIIGTIISPRYTGLTIPSWSLDSLLSSLDRRMVLVSTAMRLGVLRLTVFVVVHFLHGQCALDISGV